EHFMADELVAEAQAVLVDDAVLVHDDRVLEAAAERALALARGFQVTQEAEGSRAADLFQERRRRKVHRHGLTMLAQRRVVEVDLDVETEAVMRVEAHPLVAFDDL